MYIESIIHTYNNSTTVWSRPSIYCITTVPTPSWVKDKSHEETKHPKETKRKATERIQQR